MVEDTNRKFSIPYDSLYSDAKTVPSVYRYTYKLYSLIDTFCFHRLIVVFMRPKIFAV